MIENAVTLSPTVGAVAGEVECCVNVSSVWAGSGVCSCYKFGETLGGEC